MAHLGPLTLLEWRFKRVVDGLLPAESSALAWS